MIAASSPRPFKGCPTDIWDMQVNANHSWRLAFDEIWYWGEPHPDLTDRNVMFMPWEKHPTIHQLAVFLAGQSDWGAILNADILIGPNWPRALNELKRSRVDCAVSRRWEIPADSRLDGAKVTDFGLDFFAAKPDIWRRVALEVPPELCLGKIMWDTWMLGFFMHASADNCADLTPARVIFHPKHGDRREQHVTPTDSPYFHRVRWPGYQIGKEWPLRLPPTPVRTGGGGSVRV